MTLPQLTTLEFLIERVCDPDSSWVGASSTAMLRVALNRSDYPSRWPMDDGDLGRCEETYRRAPASLRKAMLPWLKKFREHVKIGGLHCRGCDTSGHSGTSGGLCHACREAGAAPFDGSVSVVIGKAS